MDRLRRKELLLLLDITLKIIEASLLGRRQAIGALSLWMLPSQWTNSITADGAIISSSSILMILVAWTSAAIFGRDILIFHLVPRRCTLAPRALD